MKSRAHVAAALTAAILLNPMKGTWNPAVGYSVCAASFIDDSPTEENGNDAFFDAEFEDAEFIEEEPEASASAEPASKDPASGHEIRPSEEEALSLHEADQDPEVSTAAEPDVPEDTIASHVSGLKDFSIIQGMKPDVMTGITWDETIESVEAYSNQVDWNRSGVQILKFQITSVSGEKAIATVRITVWPDLDFFLYGMEGEIVVNEGNSFDPMEGITWGAEISSVTADTSEVDRDVPGRYLISYSLTGTDGHVQNTVRQVIVSDGTYNPNYGMDYYENAAANIYDLGLWRLTAYMDTPADQGIYVGKTASGAPLVAGRTVAVSAATCARLGLVFGDRLMIDGHIYILEDHGGPAMYDQNWVDIFVDNPVDEYSERFNRYTEVYLLR